FQEYLIGLRAQPPALRIVSQPEGPVRPSPGVLEAVHEADVVLLAPSNPVVSIGTILSVPGIRQALCDTTAPVIGISPIIGTAPVRGIAHQVLAAVGVPISASAVAEWYGARVLDGWLVDTSDSAAAHQVSASGIACRPAPLLMTDIAATTEMVRQAMSLAAREPVSPQP
ncbi:MAG: YvcK family protein, partial [Mycobacterium sp.]|nr:YvcK family protein [Mycobacterium sp.]